MTLSIGHIDVQIRAPAGLRAGASDLAEWFPRAAAQAIDAHLGPSLERTPGVVRIRKVHVRLHVRAGKWDRGAIVELWLRELAKHLFIALSYPSDPDGAGVYRAEDAAHFQACFLTALVSGNAGAWPFATALRQTSGSSRREVIVRALTRGSVPAAQVLSRLEAMGRSDAVLGVLEERELELVLRHLTQARGGAQPSSAERELSAEDVEAAVGLWRELPLVAARRIDDHRNALRIVARRPELHPRSVLQGLRAARWLATRWLEPPDASVPLELQNLLAALRSEASSARRERLRAVLEDAGLAPPAERGGAMTPWRASPVAGVLLVLPVLERQGWYRLAGDPVLEQVGSAAFRALLAAVALDLAGASAETGLSDPAVFALAGELAPVAARTVEHLASHLDPKRCARISELLGEETNAATAAELVQVLSARLALSFGRQVRGFHAAPAESIRRHLLRRPGRILFTERELVVALEPAPYNIALHYSGADSPLSTSAWFGRREVRFQLEGL
ncbi:MAG TPA: hypothetical protein VG937_10570 [Polyangiaceae bacterium]|nr:hypothetical protein [Polyangiaceae bacterium]